MVALEPVQTEKNCAKCALQGAWLDQEPLAKKHQEKAQVSH